MMAKIMMNDEICQSDEDSSNTKTQKLVLVDGNPNTMVTMNATNRVLRGSFSSSALVPLSDEVGAPSNADAVVSGSGNKNENNERVATAPLSESRSNIIFVSDSLAAQGFPSEELPSAITWHDLGTDIGLEEAVLWREVKHERCIVEEINNLRRDPSTYAEIVATHLRFAGPPFIPDEQVHTYLMRRGNMARSQHLTSTNRQVVDLSDQEREVCSLQSDVPVSAKQLEASLQRLLANYDPSCISSGGGGATIGNHSRKEKGEKGPGSGGSKNSNGTADRRSGRASDRQHHQVITQNTDYNIGMKATATMAAVSNSNANQENNESRISAIACVEAAMMSQPTNKEKGLNLQQLIVYYKHLKANIAELQGQLSVYQKYIPLLAAAVDIAQKRQEAVTASFSLDEGNNTHRNFPPNSGALTRTATHKSLHSSRAGTPASGGSKHSHDRNHSVTQDIVSDGAARATLEKEEQEIRLHKIPQIIRRVRELQHYLKHCWLAICAVRQLISSLLQLSQQQQRLPESNPRNQQKKSESTPVDQCALPQLMVTDGLTLAARALCDDGPHYHVTKQPNPVTTHDKFSHQNAAKGLCVAAENVGKNQQNCQEHHLSRTRTLSVNVRPPQTRQMQRKDDVDEATANSSRPQYNNLYLSPAARRESREAAKQDGNRIDTISDQTASGRSRCGGVTANTQVMNPSVFEDAFNAISRIEALSYSANQNGHYSDAKTKDNIVTKSCSNGASNLKHTKHGSNYARNSHDDSQKNHPHHPIYTILCPQQIVTHTTTHRGPTSAQRLLSNGNGGTKFLRHQDVNSPENADQRPLSTGRTGESKNVASTTEVVQTQAQCPSSRFHGLPYMEPMVGTSSRPLGPCLRAFGSGEGPFDHIVLNGLYTPRETLLQLLLLTVTRAYSALFDREPPAEPHRRQTSSAAALLPGGETQGVSVGNVSSAGSVIDSAKLASPPDTAFSFLTTSQYADMHAALVASTGPLHDMNFFFKLLFLFSTRFIGCGWRWRPVPEMARTCVVLAGHYADHAALHELRNRSDAGTLKRLQFAQRIGLNDARHALELLTCSSSLPTATGTIQPSMICLQTSKFPDLCLITPDRHPVICPSPPSRHIFKLLLRCSTSTNICATVDPVESVNIAPKLLPLLSKAVACSTHEVPRHSSAGSSASRLAIRPRQQQGTTLVQRTLDLQHVEVSVVFPSAGKYSITLFANSHQVNGYERLGAIHVIVPESVTREYQDDVASPSLASQRALSLPFVTSDFNERMCRIICPTERFLQPRELCTFQICVPFSNYKHQECARVATALQQAQKQMNTVSQDFAVLEQEVQNAGLKLVAAEKERDEQFMVVQNELNLLQGKGSRGSSKREKDQMVAVARRQEIESLSQAERRVAQLAEVLANAKKNLQRAKNIISAKTTFIQSCMADCERLQRVTDRTRPLNVELCMSEDNGAGEEHGHSRGGGLFRRFAMVPVDKEGTVYGVRIKIPSAGQVSIMINNIVVVSYDVRDG